MKETWKSVVGYEGLYDVSDLGRVRSLDRTVRCGTSGTKILRGQIMKPCPVGQHGHVGVGLARHNNTQRFLIHRLVLTAFVGPCPPGKEGLHWDDVPTNNRLDNLRWGTRGENMYDKVRNGHHHQTRKTLCPKKHPLVPRPGYEPHRWCPICHDAARWRYNEKRKAANRAKTVCPKGHKLSEMVDGRKYCPVCASDRARGWMAARMRNRA